MERITWKSVGRLLETLHIVLPAPAGERYGLDAVPATNRARLVLLDQHCRQRYPFSGEGLTAREMDLYLRGLMDGQRHTGGAK